MKKYQQLVLLIFSFVSLILFLVYRHEYNRLHYVLEVFNFFGTPCNFSELNGRDKLKDHFDWGQSPVWQEYEDHQVFSGFFNESHAQAIVLRKKGSMLPRKCFLWFEDHNPMIGVVSAQKLSETDEHEAYIYNCGFKYLKSMPYALSFHSKSKYSFSKKVILTQLEKRANPIKATVCVLPSTYNKRELVEFISFHRVIGFKHFILYYNDIPYSLMKFLSNFNDILEMDLTFYPWNFPGSSSSLGRSIIENDCLLRTFGKSESSIVLDLNEYLLPLDSYGIYPLFQENLHPYLTEYKHVDIPVQTICIQKNHTIHPIAVQNRNSYDDGSLRVIKFHFNANASLILSRVKNSVPLVVNAYKYCQEYSGRFIVDKSISLYTTDFVRFPLIQALSHNQL